MLQEYTATPITLEIVQRECCKYAREDKSDSKACQCGRTSEWHEQRGIDINTEHTKWRLETHTETVPCDSFGEISFKGFDHHTENPPYIRLDSNTDLEKVWKILMEYWHLPSPKCLISVSGSAKYFDVRPEVRCILKKALCHAATTTGTWIITAGTGTGIMKMVGEAVHEYSMGHCFPDQKIVTLGITTWGMVSNRSALESLEKGKGRFPAEYAIDDIQKDTKAAPLDHNHSHFILVDNGTENIYGGEREFRAKLENYISKNSGVHVPLVILVVEGGANTMVTIRESVQQDIPVVVIEGTGKAADFISFGYKLTKPSDNDPGKSDFPGDFDKIMKDNARSMFVWDGNSKEEREEIIKECFNDLKATLQCRNLITIFNLETADPNKDLNQAIFSALIKAKRLDVNTQLKLALAWNCCDIARKEIFNKENSKNREEINLNDAMKIALEKDRADFVNLFIDCGVNLRKFLTIKTLHSLYLKLYNNKPDTQAEFFCQLIFDVRDTWKAFLLRRSTKIGENFPDLLNNVNELIVQLLGHQPFNFYSAGKFQVKKESEQEPLHDGSISSERKKKEEKEMCDFENPEQHLFIWAVFFNRKEMAALFWQRGKDQLGAGLFASALLKSLSEKAELLLELELSRNLASHAELFERRSTELLSECYHRDKEMSHELLIRQLPSWGKMTVFSIANTYKMMDFMDHTSCQTKLNSVWKGRIVPYTSELKIFFCMLIPLILLTVKFTSKKESIKRGTERSTADNNKFDTSDSQKNPNPNELKVALCGCDSSKICFPSAGILFLFAPITKFYMYLVNYFLFLIDFSYFVLIDLQAVEESHFPCMCEFAAWIWVATMMIEEIRQIIIRSEYSFRYKLLHWFSDIWNKFDICMYTLLILSVIVRWSLTGSDFKWARRAYSVTLIVSYLRSMQFLLASKHIGPKVIMIYKMLNDLKYFLYIFFVFVVSFGIAYNVNMFPNSHRTWNTFRNTVLVPYLQLYGEIFLERLEGEEIPGCTRNQTILKDAPELRCPEADGFNILLLSLYLLLTNILLVNLVIAMFSYTFQTVQEKSMKIWRFYRIALIYDYNNCPILTPPFIFFNHLYRVMRWMLHKSCNVCEKPNALKNKDADNEKLSLFEKVATNHYLSHIYLLERQKLDNFTSKITERSVSDETVDNLSNEQITRL